MFDNAVYFSFYNETIVESARMLNSLNTGKLKK